MHKDINLDEKNELKVVQWDTFVKKFNITLLELKLCKSIILNGFTLADYSVQTFKSLHTVKSQLKSIFKKTQAHSQSELIRIILSEIRNDETQKVDNNILNEIRWDDFAINYKITPSELKIVKGLATGISLNDIANLNDVSIYTVKVHLKNIFKKIKVDKQQDLLLILFTIYSDSHNFGDLMTTTKNDFE